MIATDPSGCTWVDPFLDALSNGPTATLVEGEPGIGRSTVFDQVVTRARSREIRTMVARPAETERDLGLIGLRDLIDPMMDVAGDDLDQGHRHALDDLVLRTESIQEDPGSLSVALLSLIRTLSAREPLLIAVDDVQWLDLPSLHSLAFVARRLVAEAVGFLLTRPADIEGPLPVGLDAWPPAAVRTEVLPPLTETALRALIAERLHVPLSESEAAQLAQVSGGNPFFALEIARAMARGDRAATGQGIPIPRTLRDDVVRGHVGSLPETCHELLLVVAAASRPTLEMLQMLGWPSPGLDLQPAIDAGIVTVDGKDIRFVHPLYRSALYADASRERRHRVHGQLVAVARDPDDLARHRALAADGPDSEVASSLERSAARARASGARSLAADRLRHALRLTPEADLQDRHRRRLLAADDRFRSGDVDAALELIEDAMDVPAGPDRMEATLRRVSILTEIGRVDEAREELDAIPVGPQHPLPDPSALYLARGSVALRLGDLPGAERYAKQGATSTDPVIADAARAVRVEVAALEGSTRRRLRGRAHLQTNHPGFIQTSSCALAAALVQIGAHAEATDMLNRLRLDAVDRHDIGSVVVVDVALAEVELRNGRTSDARGHALSAVEASSRLGWGRSRAFAALAAADAVTGRSELASDHAAAGLDAAGDDAFGKIANLGGAGAALLWAGEPEEARAPLDAAGAMLEATRVGEPAAFLFVPDLVEAALAVDDGHVAAKWIDWLQERGEALDRPFALAAAARCAGLRSALQGDLDGALDAFARAMQQHDRLSMPFERARTSMARGAVLRRSGVKRAAREALEEALTAFERVGAIAWSARTRGEVGKIGGRRATTELTVAESKVARLAAAGRTNREIASTLFMSIRTVESHLSRIYAKLHLRSRTELAVFLDTIGPT